MWMYNRNDPRAYLTPVEAVGPLKRNNKQPFLDIIYTPRAFISTLTDKSIPKASRSNVNVQHSAHCPSIIHVSPSVFCLCVGPIRNNDIHPDTSWSTTAYNRKSFTTSKSQKHNRFLPSIICRTIVFCSYERMRTLHYARYIAQLILQVYVRVYIIILLAADLY